MDWREQQQNQNIASFVGQKFGEIDEKYNSLRSDTDPEKLEYRKEMAQLKATPEFAELDDATALKVAKALKNAKVPGRGTVSGKRVTSAPKPKTHELSDEDFGKMFPGKVRG
jgi:hypothetical protein